MMPAEASYWINTICLDHVRRGVEGGFTQADHGRDTRLRRLHAGDGIVFYSPRTTMRGREPVQQFTALGTVIGEEPYQVTMTPQFHPWRLKVAFRDCRSAPIAPLIERLSFITDKRHWGYPFRRGLFRIDADDFGLIERSMVETPSSEVESHTGPS